jgi:hypothetical protein
MMVIALALALSGQADSTPAQADVWAWDPKMPICSLKQQSYPNGETIEIERTPGSEETELEITLPRGTKLREGNFIDATVTTDSGPRFAADIAIGVNRSGHIALYVDSTDPAFIDHLSRTSTLEVAHPKIGSVKVPIHVAPAIVATLRECENNTMTEWGIDPVTWRSLEARPLPLNHVRDRFSALDYPLAANVEADAIIRLDIAPDGSVSACRAVGPALLHSFETASCEVLKGAKFRPAVDSSGKPVSAPVVYDVRFRIGN